MEHHQSHMATQENKLIQRVFKEHGESLNNFLKQFTCTLNQLQLALLEMQQ